jgi:hypothetical protein
MNEFARQMPYYLTKSERSARYLSYLTMTFITYSNDVPELLLMLLAVSKLKTWSDLQMVVSACRIEKDHKI